MVLLPSASGAQAAGSRHVYWSDNGTNDSHGTTIGRADVDGTGADQNFISDASSPTAVAVDAGHVYWANLWASTIGRANLDGTGADQNFITGADVPRGLAVDASHVYWTNPNLGTIGRANLDGTGVDQNFITLGPAAHPFGLAVDTNHVYWTNSNLTNPNAGTIGRASLDGTSVNPGFITSANSPAGVAVDSTHIYWSNLGRRPSIWRANLDGTLARVFIRHSLATSFPIAVAVDASYLYCANWDVSTIARVSLNGKRVNPSFITGLNHPAGLAVDSG